MPARSPDRPWRSRTTRSWRTAWRSLAASSVGLVRHNKYRIATVTPDATGQLCRLTVTEGPLTPAAGWRSFADLRVGEPVTALASRTSAEVAAAAGWLAGKGSNADPYLEATSAVPDGNRSAVLFDGFGNLIGLGAAAPVAGGLMLAVPVDARVAPALVNRDLGAADVLLAALTPTPRAQPRQAPILLAVGSDDRNSADRAPPARQAEADADRGTGGREPSAGPAPGSPGEAPASGAGAGGTGAGGTGGTGGSTSGPGGEIGAAPTPGGTAEAPEAAPDAGPTPGDGPVGPVGRPGGEAVADDDGVGRGRSRHGRGDGHWEVAATTPAGIRAVRATAATAGAAVAAAIATGTAGTPVSVCDHLPAR